MDVIVVGGGHAGVEAALACARNGYETMLCSIRTDMIASMPCNPSIGGPAKGIVVREIDALGGQMGITADKTALQVKMLNTTKGPGVQSLRVQSDKIAYKQMMQDVCLAQEHLTVLEGIVETVLAKNGKVTGIRMQDGTEYMAKCVVLTTGTYMASTCMISDEVTPSGPDGQPTTGGISESLRQLGFTTFRLKTGTPPRVLTETIDFSKAQLERGSEEPYTFSDTTTEVIPYDKQVPCYLIYTNEATHKFILDNLHRSSMYSGVVKGVGPRYCPSIEDKLVRFKDKERHQLFLEPESLQLPTTYVQGFSTSLPRNVQEKMVHSLPGLENCTIVKYAYAIEYDAIDPLQLKPSLETKLIDGLFCAGQINGTSGYEEAAGQGLIAGINVCQKLRGKAPLILKRDEAYIGVMIDDLVTKGTKEPYRLLTSRAEYRLLLRHDNADQRLLEYGHEVGLIDDARYQKYQDKMNRLCKLKEDLKEIRLTPKSKENEILVLHGYEPLQEGCSGYEIIRRPHLEIKEFAKMWGWEEEDALYRQAEIEIKYEGYIEKAKREAKHLQSLERLVLPEDLDYNAIDQLSLEARQKLQQVRPLTVGQASRISGVNPADISVLSIVLEQRKRGGTV